MQIHNALWFAKGRKPEAFSQALLEESGIMTADGIPFAEAYKALKKADCEKRKIMCNGCYPDMSVPALILREFTDVIVSALLKLKADSEAELSISVFEGSETDRTLTAYVENAHADVGLLKMPQEMIFALPSAIYSMQDKGQAMPSVMGNKYPNERNAAVICQRPELFYDLEFMKRGNAQLIIMPSGNCYEVGAETSFNSLLSADAADIPRFLLLGSSCGKIIPQEIYDKPIWDNIPANSRLWDGTVRYPTKDMCAVCWLRDELDRLRADSCGKCSVSVHSPPMPLL